MKTISEKLMKQLLRAEEKLSALEAGGVDNWEGYNVALSKYNKELDLEELQEDFIAKISEEVLIEMVEVDYPAGPEAGHSVNLTHEGEAYIEKILQQYIDDYKAIENR